ncbi:MAG: class I SAM-dependent methyltransferase [Lentisphaeria bacterium]|nr:class I SAM-dependent methyltransferase [Lentisphaeria bacterium]
MKYPELTTTARELFDLPATAQRMPNICSMVNFFAESKRLMDGLGISCIVEIGSEAGINTKVLLDYIKNRNGKLITVDPAEIAFPFASETETAFEFLRETSNEFLRRKQIAEVIFLDGDHNYESVLEDLQLIHENRDVCRTKLVFMHDVNWPWGRRDIYYAPERIKHPQPYKKDFAVSPYIKGDENALPAAGYATATTEGGPRNGVLTAVEDFLKQYPEQWTFLRIPVLYGIGILCSNENLLPEEKNHVSGCLGELASHRDLFATLELNRIENLCYIESLHTQLNGAGQTWRNDQAYIKEVNALLPSFSRQIESLQSDNAQKDLSLKEKEESLQQAQVLIQKNLQELENASSRLAHTEQELQSTSSKLAGAEQELQSTSSKLAEAEQELQSTSSKLAETEQELQSTSSKLAGAEQELQSTSLKLAGKEQELQQTAQKLSATEQELQQTVQLLSATEQKFQNTELELSEKEQELTRTKDHLQTVCEQKTTIESELSGTQAELAKTTGELNSTTKILNQTKLDLIDRTGQLEQTSKELTESLGRESSLREVVWTRDQKIREMTLGLKSEGWRYKEFRFAKLLPYPQRNRKRLSKAAEMLNSGAVKMLSLDIFDTLLFRRVDSELLHFRKIALAMQKQIPEIPAEDFYSARALAHDLAYRTCMPVEGCREASCREIFRIMARILQREETFGAELLRMELDYERKNLFLNKSIWQLVKLAGEKQIPVILASDMYWGEEELQDLIRTLLPEPELISRIYSSSGAVSKASGLLFDRILREESCPAESILHIGDNAVADFREPYLRCGIMSIWMPRSVLYKKRKHRQQKKFEKSLYERGILHGIR